MAYSVRIRTDVYTGSASYGAAPEYSAESLSSVDASFANGLTNAVLSFTCDVSQVKAFVIQSDYALTIKTNSSGSPTNTLNLVGGVPYVWTVDSYDTFKLTGDVTVIYVTNASGSTAQLKITCLTDPTP